MKRSVISAGLFLSLTLASCNSGIKSVDPSNFDETMDSVSYAFGINTGHDIVNQWFESIKKNSGDSIDADIFLSGLIEGYETALKQKGKSGDDSINVTTKMTQDEAKEVVDAFFKKVQDKQMAEIMKQAEENEAQGKAFQEENKKKEGVIVTESGLQYKVLSCSNSKVMPKSDDQMVTVHYTGKLIDGTVFDSSVERGEPAVFPVGGVIKGWVEGLKLMHVGDKYEFVIPSNLAYGQRGAGQTIKPNSTLVFEVELIKVEDAPKR